MKLYEITITATIDDLESLQVSLSAEIDVDPQLQTIATEVLPTHLRKIADDMEDVS